MTGAAAIHRETKKKINTVDDAKNESIKNQNEKIQQELPFPAAIKPDRREARREKPAAITTAVLIFVRFLLPSSLCPLF